MRFLLGLAIAALLSACGGKVFVDGAQDAGPPTSCDRACERVETACGQLTVASCSDQCEQVDEANQAFGCGPTDEKLEACIVEAPEDVDCSSGVPPSCNPLYEEWMACSQGG